MVLTPEQKGGSELCSSNKRKGMDYVLNKHEYFCIQFVIHKTTALSLIASTQCEYLS